MGYYRRMKPKKNTGKFKFPVDIKGDLELPDMDLSANFTSPELKSKITSEFKEVSVEKNKKKKCQSNKLM
jgi:hypothetical protein